MDPQKIAGLLDDEIAKENFKLCEVQTNKSAGSLAKVTLPQLQFRKIIIAKAICDDGLTGQLYEISRRLGLRPFVNLQLRKPDDVPNFKKEVLYEITKSGFNREFVLWFDWGKRDKNGNRTGKLFPAFVSYLCSPLPAAWHGEKYKLIELDKEQLINYVDPSEAKEFEKLVSRVVEANLNNRLLVKSDLTELYEIVIRIRDILRGQKDLNPQRIYYTGNGFQIWGRYNYDIIKRMLGDNMICKSNANPLQLQRLNSVNMIKSNPHFQTCINCDCTFTGFKYSNPSFFQFPHDPTLYDMIDRYMDCFFVSNYWSDGVEDELVLYDRMMGDKKEWGDKIRSYLGVGDNNG